MILSAVEEKFKVELADLTILEQNKEAIGSAVDRLMEMLETKVKQSLQSMDFNDPKFDNLTEEQKEAIKEYDLDFMEFNLDDLPEEAKQQIEEQKEALDEQGIDLEAIGDFSQMKDMMSEQIRKAYVPAGTLVLYTRTASEENELTDALDLFEDAGNGEGIEDYIVDFAVEAGLDDLENMSEEEVEEAITEIAQDIADAFTNGTTPKNSAAKALMQQLGSKKSRHFGLWKALYIAMKVIERIPDFKLYLYSTALCLVVCLYFTLGCLYLSIHFGGISIFGIGLSLICFTIQNLITAVITMQRKAQDTNYLTNTFTQCQGIMESWGTMFQGGEFIELVIGVWMPGVIPLPFVGIGKKTSIAYKTFPQYLLLIAVLAAYIILWTTGLICNLTRNNKLWDNMLGLVFKDGDDLLACFMAAGVKLSILLSLTRSMEFTAMSQGIGLLLPIGP